MKLAAFHISPEQALSATAHGGAYSYARALVEQHWPGELCTPVTVGGTLHVYRQVPVIPTHHGVEVWQ